MRANKLQSGVKYHGQYKAFAHKGIYKAENTSQEHGTFCTVECYDYSL